MGSLTPKIISKSSNEYRYIAFKELQEDFFLSSLMNIKISHSHHFINFDFTISGEDPFLIKNGFVKPFVYTQNCKRGYGWHYRSSIYGTVRKI